MTDDDTVPSQVTHLPAASPSAAQAILERPRPPAELVSFDSGGYAFDTFAPAPEVTAWILDAFLNSPEHSPLYTEDHWHLKAARFGVLWTNAENTRNGRRIVGQAEMPARANKGGKWQKARSEQQIRDWFGDPLPDFLITLDALHAAECDDAAFCALVDHELYHCAQATDDFGMPRFNQTTGDPMWAIRGHDVEEFVGVVRRFGIEAAGEEATNLVIAAAQKPEVAATKLAQACGTCMDRRAA